MKKQNAIGITLLMGILFLSSTKIMQGMNQDENQLGLLDEIIVEAFFNHVATGNTAMVMEALESGRIGVNHHNSDGLSALHVALFYGQPEMAKMLIEYGADVNDRFPTSESVDPEFGGYSPLMMVASANEDPNYKQQQRADIEAEGQIPVDSEIKGSISRADKLELMRLLLEKGADQTVKVNRSIGIDDLVAVWEDTDPVLVELRGF